MLQILCVLAIVYSANGGLFLQFQNRNFWCSMTDQRVLHDYQIEHDGLCNGFSDRYLTSDPNLCKRLVNFGYYISSNLMNFYAMWQDKLQAMNRVKLVYKDNIVLVDGMYELHTSIERIAGWHHLIIQQKLIFAERFLPVQQESTLMLDSSLEE